MRKQKHSELIDSHAEHRDQKKRKRMRVSGKRVLKLHKLIMEKEEKV